MFRELIKTIGLATVSKFDYTPSSDEIRGLLVKKSGKGIKSIPHNQSECNPQMKQMWQECAEELQKIETDKPYIKRQVTGDASETGLIKFIQPLLENDEEGCFKYEKGLEGLRDAHPIISIGTAEKPALAMIPFSSDIKFNLIIRDMNCKEPTPASVDDNMYVYLKGAPERVVNRCSTLLVKGDKEIPLSASVLE